MRRATLIAGALGVALAILASTGTSPRSGTSTGAPTVAASAPPRYEEPVRSTALTTPRVDMPGQVGGRAPRIYVPRLDLASRVYPSTRINAGPSWWTRTGRPYGGDTVAIAGHRTTHSRPFYYLERLRPGDRIFVSWQGRTQEYEVAGNRVLSAKNMHIADARGHEVLLLSSCTPRGSASHRLVVYAYPKEER